MLLSFTSDHNVSIYPFWPVLQRDCGYYRSIILETIFDKSNGEEEASVSGLNITLRVFTERFYLFSLVFLLGGKPLVLKSFHSVNL